MLVINCRVIKSPQTPLLPGA